MSASSSREFCSRQTRLWQSSSSAVVEGGDLSRKSCERRSLCPTDRSNARICYTSADIRTLRSKVCPGIPRRLKRYLFYLGLLVPCVLPHVISSSIPVRITAGSLTNVHVTQTRPRCLKKVPIYNLKRHSKRPRNTYPSILLSNVRSLAGKIDEVRLRVSQLLPSIIVFTESWLCEEIPDEDVALEGYVLSRKDRNKHGGGIVCYVHKDIIFSAVNISNVPLLPVSDSEFLCLYLESSYVFLICIYHPFWDNQAANEALFRLSPVWLTLLM